jgi:hypothetical protein
VAAQPIVPQITPVVSYIAAIRTDVPTIMRDCPVIVAHVAAVVVPAIVHHLARIATYLAMIGTHIAAVENYLPHVVSNDTRTPNNPGALDATNADTLVHVQGANRSSQGRAAARGLRAGRHRAHRNRCGSYCSNQSVSHVRYLV